MLCRKHQGVDLSQFPFKRAPQTWKPEVLALAKFYACAPSELFPADVLCMEKTTFEKEMDAQEIAGYLTASDDYGPEVLLTAGANDRDRDPTISDALNTITSREAEILRFRFGIGDGKEHTLCDAGKRFGLSKESVRKIEGKALRKLRHPSRAIKLRSLWRDTP
jgi:DNA-directed RNA polymerase sigma subunit (sigma70/sigma32)